MIFSDHHNFVKNDIIELIRKIKTSADPSRTIVVTTEKDAMRLRNIPGLPKSLMRRIFYLPVSVKFLPNLASSNQPASREFADILIKKLSPARQQ